MFGWRSAGLDTLSGEMTGDLGNDSVLEDGADGLYPFQSRFGWDCPRSCEVSVECPSGAACRCRCRAIRCWCEEPRLLFWKKPHDGGFLSEARVEETRNGRMVSRRGEEVGSWDSS